VSFQQQQQPHHMNNSRSNNNNKPVKAETRTTKIISKEYLFQKLMLTILTLDHDTFYVTLSQVRIESK
jgi:hypothetical protein